MEKDTRLLSDSATQDCRRHINRLLKQVETFQPKDKDNDYVKEGKIEVQNHFSQRLDTFDEDISSTSSNCKITSATIDSNCQTDGPTEDEDSLDSNVADPDTSKMCDLEIQNCRNCILKLSKNIEQCQVKINDRDDVKFFKKCFQDHFSSQIDQLQEKLTSKYSNW